LSRDILSRDVLSGDVLPWYQINNITTGEYSPNLAILVMYLLMCDSQTRCLKASVTSTAFQSSMQMSQDQGAGRVDSGFGMAGPSGYDSDGRLSTPSLEISEDDENR
jgi:hypothetical protein